MPMKDILIEVFQKVPNDIGEKFGCSCTKELKRMGPYTICD